ncbi:MAG: hypothetical protein UFG06_06385 [Lachnospiraceae bacterium]|nr:hypothetical protein [Lachnospiraceae bacterium]
MICRYCGAEYGEESIKCPYCHSENTDAAKKQKQERLNSYDKEAELIRKQAESFPERTAKKWTVYLLRGLGVLAVFCFLAVIAAICIGKFSVKRSYENEKKHLAALEELYQEKDYSGVYTYIRKEELWSSVYDKYYQAASVYDGYLYLQEAAACLGEIAAFEDVSAKEKKEMIQDQAEDFLKSVSWVLSTAKAYEEDMHFLGNEEVLHGFYEACADLLKDFGYTDEEIAQIVQGEEAEGWDGLTQKLQEYFDAQID